MIGIFFDDPVIEEYKDSWSCSVSIPWSFVSKLYKMNLVFEYKKFISYLNINSGKYISIRREIIHLSAKYLHTY